MLQNISYKYIKFRQCRQTQFLDCHENEILLLFFSVLKLHNKIITFVSIVNEARTSPK